MSVEDRILDVKSGTAILTTCIVQTINERDPTFQERFVARLDRAFAQRRDKAEKDEKEVLSWTRTLLTGFSLSGGQEKPFLSD